MKTFRSYMLFSLALLAGFVAFLYATEVQAAEQVVCSVTFTNVAAGTTASPASGTCSWLRGTMVLMSCDQDVYFSATTGFNSVVVPATAAMQRLNFISVAQVENPYPVYLSTSDKDVSVLGVTASGTCKFIVSPFRRKPN